MAIKIVDKILQFVANNANAMDRSLNRMAIDIERLSKAQVPVDKGPLRSSGYHRRKGFMKYVVVYDKEYAAFQEFGGDGTRTVRNYTTPGTKKFFLRDPGKEIAKKAVDYFKQEAKTVKV